MSSVKGLNCDRLKVKLHKSKKSKSKKHRKSHITMEESMEKWEDMRDGGGWTNEELALHLLDVHKEHCDMESCITRLHSIVQIEPVSGSTSPVKGCPTTDGSNKRPVEWESDGKDDVSLSRRSIPSSSIILRDEIRDKTKTTTRSSLRSRAKKVSRRKVKRIRKKTADKHRKEEEASDDEKPLVRMTYQLMGEGAADETPSDEDQEVTHEEGDVPVSDSHGDSVQETIDTADNNSAQPKVKKPRNPPKWAISWREMVITFSCKVCDFQTTSPVFACHHLLLAHPDIVEPLHEYLDKETIPGSEESLLSFVLETSKSKENGSIASSETQDISKTIAAIKELETYVVPVHYDSSKDGEPLFSDDYNSDMAYDESACIIQGKETNTDSCLPTDEGSAAISDIGSTIQTLDRKLMEGDEKEMKCLGENPQIRTELEESLREEVKSEKFLQGLEQEEEEIPVKKEPFSEFSLIEMEELIAYIRRWMHVDKHCNKCHSKIKGQRLTNLHHCAANTGVTLCEICGKYYRNNGYGNHVRQVHNKGKSKARCKHCNKEMTPSALFKHFRYVHERELHKVACGMCGKMMSTKEHLRRHEIIHRMEMPFKCPFCQRGFSQKSNMHHHIRQHTGEQPYNCEHCPRAFTHKVSLKNHLKKQHGIDLWKEGQTGGGRPKPKDEEEESMDDGN